jgi:hypothetical protein
MFGQRLAPAAFSQRWNRVADQRKWKIVVIAKDGTRHEAPAVMNMPIAAIDAAIGVSP